MRLAACSFILALSVGLLEGCSHSAYSRLVSEDKVADLAHLKQEAGDHPNHTTKVQTLGLSGHSQNVAIHQIELPGHDRILVFVHGVFADYSAWRFMVGCLAQDYDLWLVDLPGCGESDKPDPDTLGPDAYSPSDLASRTLQAIHERLMARGGDARLFFVAHSLGGAVTLRMFAEPQVRRSSQDVLGRIEGIVLLAPFDVLVHRRDPFFENLATVSGTQIAIGDALGIVRERAAAAMLEAVCDPSTRALREEVDRRIAVLTNPSTRNAMQAMLRRAVAWRGNRPDWNKNRAVVAGYREVRPPCLVVWGQCDEVLPVAMGYKIAAELPHARVEELPDVMHSPHIEAPEQLAGMIRGFVHDLETGAMRDEAKWSDK